MSFHLLVRSSVKSHASEIPRRALGRQSGVEECENGVSDEQIVGYVLSAGRSDVAGQQPFFGVSIEISDTSKSFPFPISIEPKNGS